MCNVIKYLIIILFLAFSGCASKSPTLSGIPIWDYERDEIKRKDFSDSSGLLLGGLAGGLGGAVQSEIELTPNDLFHTIEAALVEDTMTENITSTLKVDSSAISRWEISESNEGQIITDWKAINGRTVGLLWWKKEYQTEVRHIITITRSYKSKNYSNFSIETEVRERPNSNYKWAKANPEIGRSSFKEIKNVLLGAVRKCANTRRMKPSEN